MNLSRRGLFGLGVGAVAAGVIPAKATPKLGRVMRVRLPSDYQVRLHLNPSMDEAYRIAYEAMLNTPPVWEGPYV